LGTVKKPLTRFFNESRTAIAEKLGIDSQWIANIATHVISFDQTPGTPANGKLV
jgi:hypothetical protein